MISRMSMDDRDLADSKFVTDEHLCGVSQLNQAGTGTTSFDQASTRVYPICYEAPPRTSTDVCKERHSGSDLACSYEWGTESSTVVLSGF
jgi:hypothetical protein